MYSRKSIRSSQVMPEPKETVSRKNAIQKLEGGMVIRCAAYRPVDRHEPTSMKRWHIRAQVVDSYAEENIHRIAVMVS